MVVVDDRNQRNTDENQERKYKDVDKLIEMGSEGPDDSLHSIHEVKKHQKLKPDEPDFPETYYPKNCLETNLDHVRITEKCPSPQHHDRQFVSVSRLPFFHWILICNLNFDIRVIFSEKPKSVKYKDEAKLNQPKYIHSYHQFSWQIPYLLYIEPEEKDEILCCTE